MGVPAVEQEHRGWSDAGPSGTSSGHARHTRSERATLHRSVHAPRAAREFVHANLCGEHASPAVGTVALAASEFTTQAVLGSTGPVVISLECDITTVTLTVHYSVADSTWTHSRWAADQLSGQVVDEISRVSGAETDGDGVRRLWCTIPTGYVSLATESPHAGLPDREGPPGSR